MLVVILGFAVVALVYLIYRRPLYDMLKYPVYGGINDELKDSELFEDMRSGKSICFIGDSITFGFNKGDIPWYEPLVPYIRGEILAMSFGGWKTSDLIANGDKIPCADIYVVAIGVNDVLHFDSEDADGDAEEYRQIIEEFSRIVLGISPDAKFYFVAPWPFFYEIDTVENRAALYCETLEDWCSDSGYIYIDPNPVILSIVEEEGMSLILMTDFILMLLMAWGYTVMPSFLPNMTGECRTDHCNNYDRIMNIGLAAGGMYVRYY